MIDARLNVEKTNIFTSNLNPAQMTEALGERIASRICNKSIDIELHGTDKRNLVVEEVRKW
jgi:DNA replication protein DnaC